MSNKPLPPIVRKCAEGPSQTYNGAGSCFADHESAEARAETIAKRANEDPRVMNFLKTLESKPEGERLQFLKDFAMGYPGYRILRSNALGPQDPSALYPYSTEENLADSKRIRESTPYGADAVLTDFIKNYSHLLQPSEATKQSNESRGIMPWKPAP